MTGTLSGMKKSIMTAIIPRRLNRVSRLPFCDTNRIGQGRLSLFGLPCRILRIMFSLFLLRRAVFRLTFALSIRHKSIINLKK